MSGFYELTCRERYCRDVKAYYYFYSPRAIRNAKSALRHGYAPDGMQIIIDDCYHIPEKVRFLNPIEYIYLKYFKQTGWNFRRIDWEKELKEILDK